MSTIAVSVIIPIYGVEPYIKHCAESLFLQTMRNVEFIFVNDATLDKSMQVLDEVLTKFPERRDNVKILTHEKNKGLPTARNTGLSIASGEYIFHCDSDDFVEPTMLEDMYAKAQECQADIVWSDWYLSYGKTERYMKQPCFDCSMDALKAMLCGAMKYNVWNKLVKISLYKDNNIFFPSGYAMGEDMTMIRLMACANRVTYTPKAYYHYVKLNPNAYTSDYTKQHLQAVMYNVNLTIHFIKEKFLNKLDNEINFFTLDVKFPLLISNKWSNYVTWAEMYPQANRYILKNQHISLRNRCVQWLAWKRQYWLVWLYNILAYKIVYRLLFKM